ncbi:MAG: SprT-like domain-containing protein [Clostridiales bacterium]|nr:SprT-like domain-containing protein [Clostridiales bacterium]
MKNGTEKYIDTVKYLGKLYDYCNEKLFDGELVKPVLTVQRDERNKTNGWWSVGKVWNENGKSVNEGEHELNMTAQSLNRPIGQIAAMLIHEMCHQYASVNNMQDCSRGNTYHNKLFKKIAEKHGLIVECVPTIGWSKTDLTKDTETLIAAFVKDNPESIIYRTPVFKGQTVKTSSTRKYVCPCCNQSVRATKQVNIKCMDCDCPMVEE